MLLEAVHGIKHKNGKDPGFVCSLKENAVLKCIVADGDCTHIKMALLCYLTFRSSLICWVLLHWKPPTPNVVCIY